uniref:BMP-binding endothelial regulator protein isoform X2 n=1 Tax=Ciona intestinalis TaxID=7719 RepID=UPI000EF4F828|nr:BMP-binding endothelial regulator protein isoform X2 [Ciona intestinalis]|eukprot:XP_026695387.1 BMP-binding endothelial regulator protein isoform X2 [Ciona intestinalis]
MAGWRWEVLLLWVLIWSLVDCQFKGGTKEHCNNEGEVLEIPTITDDPCISCRCMNGVVKCSRERCAKPDCNVLVYDKNDCCPQCADCDVNNATMKSSNAWSSTPDCGLLHCKNGIATSSEKKCYSTCSNPLPPSNGECCPTCAGCSFNDVIYSNGETFTIDDVCVDCQCKDGNIRCWMKVCPVLACGRHRAVFDGCCYKCQGRRRLFKLTEGQCWFRRKILSRNEEVKLDDCTSCVCKNGTVVCNRMSCPLNNRCKQTEQSFINGHCCSFCPDEILNNCSIDGHKYEHGTRWRRHGNPCVHCLCNNGTISCLTETCSLPAKKCPAGEVLESLPGKCCQSCIPEPGICAVFGDPHYRTFDGRPFNFQGDCKYVLTKDCRDQNYSVIVENNAKRSRQFSWTKTIYFRTFTTKSREAIVLSLHQHLVAKLNGHKVSLPFTSEDILIFIERDIIKVRSSADISLNWDGDSYLEVGASPGYRGLLCGLCGNYNGFSRDDFIGGDGLFKSDKNKFGDSWKYDVINDVTGCSRPDYSLRPQPCSHNIAAKINSRKKCSIFKSPMFQRCYNKVAPEEYYKSCLTDVCSCPPTRKCACESIKAYTSSCAREGVHLTWNKRSHCKTTTNVVKNDANSASVWRDVIA